MPLRGQYLSNLSEGSLSPWSNISDDFFSQKNQTVELVWSIFFLKHFKLCLYRSSGTALSIATSFVNSSGSDRNFAFRMNLRSQKWKPHSIHHKLLRSWSPSSHWYGLISIWYVLSASSLILTLSNYCVTRKFFQHLERRFPLVIILLYLTRHSLHLNSRREVFLNLASDLSKSHWRVPSSMVS